MGYLLSRRGPEWEQRTGMEARSVKRTWWEITVQEEYMDALVTPNKSPGHQKWQLPLSTGVIGEWQVYLKSLKEVRLFSLAKYSWEKKWLMSINTPVVVRMMEGQKRTNGNRLAVCKIRLKMRGGFLCFQAGWFSLKSERHLDNFKQQLVKFVVGIMRHV